MQTLVCLLSFKLYFNVNVCLTELFGVLVVVTLANKTLLLLLLFIQTFFDK